MRQGCLFFILSLLISATQNSYGFQAVPQEAETCRDLFVNHLRGNFDEIHDVSMRFHHLDHELNGLISFDMKWRKGRLISCSSIENETGNGDFAAALQTSMENWNIDGMEPSCGFGFSFLIKIVGSDDPSFSEKAVFTGEISDVAGHPVKDVRVRLESTDWTDFKVPDGRSNREGIFVRTLIPAGNWTVTISCPGYQDIVQEDIELHPGGHKRIKAVLKKIREP